MTTCEHVATTRKAPGTVPAGSLAAESVHKGGAFASNPGQHEQAPQKRSQQPQAAQSASRSGGGGTTDKTTPLNLENQQTARGIHTNTGKTTSETGGHSSGSSSLPNQQSYGGAAPSYLAGQQRRDPAGPHGRNLREGGFEGRGTGAGPLPEPGSAQDPARAAVRGVTAAAVSGGGRIPRRAGGFAGMGIRFGDAEVVSW